MTKLGETISQAKLDAIERRVTKLATLLEVATQNSSEKTVREGGAQLIERLSEWVEDIKDLAEVGDEDVVEVVKGFMVRLKLAEDKVKEWKIPPALVRAYNDDEALPARRRGRPPKKRLPSAA
jgi:hypothetical protein